MVFRVLSLERNPIASSYFKSVSNRLSFWIGNLQKSVKVGDERSTLIFCCSKISFVVFCSFFFFLSPLFFSPKNFIL